MDFVGVERERAVDLTLSLRPPPGPPEPEQPAAVPADVKRCSTCGVTRTPLWRNGPHGPKSLCNACGIRHRKQVLKVNTDLTLCPPSQPRKKRTSVKPKPNPMPMHA